MENMSSQLDPINKEHGAIVMVPEYDLMIFNIFPG